jgi:hypothetical protein
VDGLASIRSGQSDGFRCVGGRAEGMRTHVSDAGGLCSSPCRSHGRGRAHRPRGSSSNEPSAYLTSGIEFTASERPGSSDGITWSTICWSLRFEQDQHSLGTVCCPRCDQSTIRFAQRLRGGHFSSLPHRAGIAWGPAKVEQVWRSQPG